MQDTSKFVFGSAELDLDLDDLRVDARVQAAFDRMQEKAKALGKNQPTQSPAILYVAIVRETLNEAFGQDDAADLLLGDTSRLSDIMDAFIKIAARIGEMRTLAVTQAHGSMAAISAQLQKKRKK